MYTFYQVLFIILAYIIGSIPFGYIIGKIKGIDITQKGSGNIGATNIGRILGKKYAILVFILDFLKGALLVFLFRFKIIPPFYMVLTPMLYGFIACLGHACSVFLNFKGGKAVAAGCGMIFGYSPVVFIAAVIVFIIFKSISKLVSLGSLMGTITAFVGILVLFIIGYDPTLTPLSGHVFQANNFTVNLSALIFAFGTGAIIFIKHAANIARIKNGEEKPINY